MDEKEAWNMQLPCPKQSVLAIYFYNFFEGGIVEVMYWDPPRPPSARLLSAERSA